MVKMLITDLPAEILSIIVRFIPDFYAIRDFCYAFPELSHIIESSVGYFVLTGVGPSPRMLSPGSKWIPERRQDSFDKWFANSVSLTRNGIAKTQNYHQITMEPLPRNTDDLRFDFMGTHCVYCSTIPTNCGNCGYSDGLNRPYDSLHSSPGMSVEKHITNVPRMFQDTYSRLFLQEKVSEWFEMLLDKCKRYQHVVVIIDCPMQSALVDIALLLNYLVLLRENALERMSTPFSLVSIQYETSQQWNLDDLGSRSRSHYSLFDRFVGYDIRYYNENHTNELLLDPHYDCGAFPRYFNSKKSILDDIDGYPLAIDDDIDEDILDMLLCEIKKHKGEQYPLTDISSIHQVNLRSVNLVLFRDGNELPYPKTDSPCRRSDGIYHFACYDVHKLEDINLGWYPHRRLKNQQELGGYLSIGFLKHIQYLIFRYKISSDYYTFIESEFSGYPVGPVKIDFPARRSFNSAYRNRAWPVMDKRVLLASGTMYHLPVLDSGSLDIRIPFFVHKSDRAKYRDHFKSYERYLSLNYNLNPYVHPGCFRRVITNRPRFEKIHRLASTILNKITEKFN